MDITTSENKKITLRKNKIPTDTDFFSSNTRYIKNYNSLFQNVDFQQLNIDEYSTTNTLVKISWLLEEIF
jgi:hypothetical protein